MDVQLFIWIGVSNCICMIQNLYMAVRTASALLCLCSLPLRLPLLPYFMQSCRLACDYFPLACSALPSCLSTDPDGGGTSEVYHCLSQFLHSTSNGSSHFPLSAAAPAPPVDVDSKPVAPSALSFFSVRSRWYSMTRRFLKYVTCTRSRLSVLNSIF